MYVHRFAPTGWLLAGCEVLVGAAVADLVWRSEAGAVVIDEVKSGAASLDDDKVAEQLARLAGGGLRVWGERFEGVRLVPLGSPAATCVVELDGGRLVRRGFPEGLDPT